MRIDFGKILRKSSKKMSDDQLLTTLMRRIIKISHGDLAVWYDDTASDNETQRFTLYVDECITITADEYQQLINMGATSNYEDDE